MSQEITRLVSALRIAVAPRHKQFKNPDGPRGRLNKMRSTVTALIKYERIELLYPRADEARGYAERLISDAIRYGDCHKETMEIADFWLTEKQLVHKLFKVLVPRYENFQTAYTRLALAPNVVGAPFMNQAILELRGNPYPPLPHSSKNHPYWLHNVLLEEAKRDYREDKMKMETQSSES